MSPLSEVHRQIALELDAADPLKEFRGKFALPNDPKIYFCNNSLGLPALSTFSKMQELLQKWSELGVEGWFHDETKWYSAVDTQIKMHLTGIFGAQFEEVVVMNSLTVNLHLLLVSFYQPSVTRFKILIDGPVFPSDLYAIKSHLTLHGIDVDQALICVEPREGEHHIRQDDINEILRKEGESIALVFFAGVNFLTGHVMEMEAITALAKEKGCTVGFDVAHAAGNIPLHLHQWKVDFAVGCSYKYLCSGPGGPGIAFVHADHHKTHFPRLSGWWGNDPAKRFQMQLEENFMPHGGASSWQVSTPSIVAMLPLLCSLEIYDKAGMDRLRKKTELQTTFLLELLDMLPLDGVEVISPKDTVRRGAQISLLFKNDCQSYLAGLESLGVICDFRAPNIIRVTPSPLYNTFGEIYEFVSRFSTFVSKSAAIVA